MARISALRALRYNPQKIDTLSRVTAPPYDVIEADERQSLLQRDPHNIIRLVLDKPPADGRDESEFQEAAKTLQEWRADGTLVQDEEPSIYVCRQEFQVGEQTFSRTGFMAGLLLEPFGEGQVYPHEHTMPGPRADRLELMKACRANLSPVFTIYSDPGGTCAEFVRQVQEREPLHDFSSAEERRCTVWRVEDPEWIERLRELLGPQTVCIADGHHRYETALHYRNNFRQSDAPPGESPEDYTLALFVSVADPGLTVLPTHRAVSVSGDFDARRVLAHLNNTFARMDHSVGGGDLDKAWEDFQEAGASIGCYLPDGNLSGVRLSDSAAAGDDPDAAPSADMLPVTVLNDRILKPLFGDSDGELNCDIEYHHVAEDVRQEVDSGHCQVGFLLPPLPPEVVERVARSGQKLPPKSTYFYPKVPSGLLIHPFE